MLCSNSQVAEAAASSGCIITLTGSLLGMQFDALTLGFVAGVIVLSFQEGQPLGRQIAGVFLSTLLAGSLAPICAALAVRYLGLAADPGLFATRIACAFIIGLAAQTAIPAALARLREYIAGLKFRGQ